MRHILDWSLFLMAWSLFVGTGLVVLGGMSWVLYQVGKFWVDTWRAWTQ